MTKKKRRNVQEIDWDRGIGFLVADITRLMTAHYNRLIKPMGLTRSQWRLIVHLYREDGLSQSELASLLGVGKVAVGGLIDRLEDSGWVERRTDQKDRRSNRVYLTANARELDEVMVSAGVELYRLTMKDLSEEESRTLEKLLTTVRANLLEPSTDKGGVQG